MGVVEYYGYRYYHTELGRWLSRDPIEEEGGFNLYAAVSNDGVNGMDLFGLAEVQYHHWLMQAPGLKARVGRICPGVNVDNFTTPYPPEHNKSGTPHHFIHYVALGSYITAYSGILLAAEKLSPSKRCCAVLLGVEILKNRIHTLLRNEYKNDYVLPASADLWSHPQSGIPQRTDAKWYRTIAAACACATLDEMAELLKKVTEGIKLDLKIPYQVTSLINGASGAGRYRYRTQPVSPELVGLAYRMPWIALSAGAAVGYAGIGVTAGGVGFSALPGSVAIPLGAGATQASRLIPQLAP